MAGDDKERELLYAVRQAMGVLYHEDDVMNVFHLIQRERAAAAAEARDKALEEAAHLVESEFNTGLLTIPPLKRMAKMIRAMRGGGR